MFDGFINILRSLRKNSTIRKNGYGGNMMSEIKNPEILLKTRLDKNDYDAIKKLEEICIRHDETSLKLELDYKLSVSSPKAMEKVYINEFMFREEGILVGYLGICDFGGSEIELNGMVHPDYRRKGVFSKLFSLASAEWQNRNSSTMLLLTDKNSQVGTNFIKSTGASYNHSEYDMVLNMDKDIKRRLNTVRLRKSTADDAEEAARQNLIYFNMEFTEEDNVETTDGSYSNITYIAEENSTSVGKVRTELNNGRGGIFGLGVLPEFRGKGYGREILTMAIEELKKNKAGEIFLQVLTDNSNALNLYKSCGFEERYTMEYYAIRKKEDL